MLLTPSAMARREASQSGAGRESRGISVDDDDDGSSGGDRMAGERERERERGCREGGRLCPLLLCWLLVFIVSFLWIRASFARKRRPPGQQEPLNFSAVTS